MDRQWTVGAEQAGQRLDLHLAEQLGISRAQARRLLDRGELRVAGIPQPAKGEPVREGWRIEVAIGASDAQARPRARPDLPLRVLAVHDDWLAVEKATGQGVHPLHPGQTDTLLNAAVARFPELAEVGESPLRGGVVHRLDVDTSGLLLLARSARGFRVLREAFRTHRVEKQYLARVEGLLDAPLQLELELEIAQRRPARVRVAASGRAPGRGRRLCRTHIQPLRPGPVESLVLARPVSGYLHQIRVSLSHSGHPVLGDRIYGQEKDRLWLHAWGLRIPELEIAVECAPDPGFGQDQSPDLDR